jgi:post-segregation antitoxin (ccd killing protein)
MKYESAILVKVDKTTKERMKHAKINWSAAIRNFINEEISRKANLAKAIAQTYKLLATQKKSKHDTTSIIRYWRDKRYGTGSR